MNRFMGLLVLCVAVLIGLGTIPGCPKKETGKATTATSKATTPAGGDTEKPTDKPKPEEGKFTLTVPGTAEAKIADKKATFDITVAREKFEKEIKLSFDNLPKGVTLKADPNPIPKEKASTTVTMTIDDMKAEAGSTEVTVTATGDGKTETGKIKIELKK